MKPAPVGAAPGRSPFPPLVDGRVLAFTALVSVVTVLLCWRSRRCALAQRHLKAADVLRGDTRTMRTGARLNASKLLVALQVALSLTLVVGAGLFGRSLLALTRIHLGFEPDRIVSVRLNLRASRYAAADLPAALQAHGRTGRTLPGVQSAVVASCRWRRGATTHRLFRSPPTNPDGERKSDSESTWRRPATIFRLWGMRLVAGRAFDERDTERAPQVAVVNEAAARRYTRWSRRTRPAIQLRRAICRDCGRRRRRACEQRAGAAGTAGVLHPIVRVQRLIRNATALEVRTTAAPGALADAVRKAVAEVAPALLVDRITTTAEQVDQNLRQEAGRGAGHRRPWVVGAGARQLRSVRRDVVQRGASDRRARRAIRDRCHPRARPLWMVAFENPSCSPLPVSPSGSPTASCWRRSACLACCLARAERSGDDCGGHGRDVRRGDAGGTRRPGRRRVSIRRGGVEAGMKGSGTGRKGRN